jgi:hypothetical protein
MKTILALVSIMVVLLVVSCEKNVITFGSTDINTATSAEVRLVYDIPVVSTTALNITRLKYNDKLVSEVSTAIGGIFPNSAAKYHVVPQGSVKVDAYTGTTKDVLQYSNTFTVGAGKFTSFIYSLTEAPYVIQDASVFPPSDAWADTTANIQFVNLLYKADGVTPYGKLTLRENVVPVQQPALMSTSPSQPAVSKKLPHLFPISFCATGSKYGPAPKPVWSLPSLMRQAISSSTTPQQQVPLQTGQLLPSPWVRGEIISSI